MIKEQLKKKFKFSKLTNKVVGILLLLGLLIAFACGIVGVIQFTKVIQEMYYTEAVQIGNIIDDYINLDDLKADIEKLKNSPQEEKETVSREIIKTPFYRDLIRFLDDLRRNINVTDVYIADFKDEDNSVSDVGTYIAGVSGSRLDPQISVIGEKITNKEGYEIIDSIYQTGITSDDYLRIDTRDGLAMNVFVPITDRDYNVVAIISVQEPMTKLFFARRDFIINVIIYSLIITLLVTVIFISVNKRILINPIQKITKATSSFVKNNNSVSEELNDIKTNDELELLADSVQQMEIDINNYIDNLTEVTKEKERVQAELNIATEIQKEMLPTIFPAFPEKEEFDIYATMEPAKEVGGDFYDMFLIDNDHLGFVVADVSGKGVPAALFMVIAKTLIKDHAQLGESPAEVFTNVNDQLCESNGADMFVTAWMGILELSTGKLTYVNAGHNPPVIKKVNENYEYLKSRPGLVLAGLEGMRYRQNEMVLNKGDKIFLYTDGVTEAQNSDDTLYGEDRLKEILDSVKDYNVFEILPIVRKDIDDFVKEAPQFDDITMVGLEYKKDIDNNEKDN